MLLPERSKTGLSDTGSKSLLWDVAGTVDRILGLPVAPVTEESLPLHRLPDEANPTLSVDGCIHVPVSVVPASLGLLKSWGWGNCRLSRPSGTLFFCGFLTGRITRYHPQVFPGIGFHLTLLLWGF